MFEFHARVLEDASNQPNASTAYNLSGTAETGHRTFASVMTDGAQCVVLAEEVDGDGNPAGAWELAECTFADASPDTLTRDTVLDSSTGSAIDWSSVGATPLLSLVDGAQGMSRKIGVWDHDDAGDTTTIAFTMAGGFRAGALYRVTFQGVIAAGTSGGTLIGFRVRRTGQGSVDSGSTDYQTQLDARCRGGTLTTNGVDANYGNFNAEGLYGDLNAGWESYDQFNGEICVVNLGEADHATVTGVANQARSSASTGHVGIGMFGCVHKTQAACDQIVFLLADGSDFGGGRIVMTEVA
jgi:hypothetical protein